MKSKLFSTHKHNYLIVGGSLNIFVGLPTYLCWTLLLDEKSFCLLENELLVIYFSNVTWKLILMAFGSYMHSLLQISEFSKHLRDIYEFSWFYSIYFWILVETCSYKLFEGFHASFEIFRFLFEQWSQIGVGIEKIGRIQTCQIFSSADGPRVRGGQSAVNWTCSSETLQRSCQPQKFIADSPPKDRGRSAHVGQRQFQSVAVYKIFKGGRSAKGPRTVRDWTESWGRPDLTYIGCPLHLPTKPNTTPKVSLSFSLKHVGKTTRSSLFGVVPGRSEHIPGLFSR